MVGQITELVAEHVPEGATVLVAAGGDPSLLSLGARRAISYPDEKQSVLADDSLASELVAISRIEQHRADGAEFLLVPSSELWRLDEFPAFERHLRRRYSLVVDDDAAVLFDLRAKGLAKATVWDQFVLTIAEYERQLHGELAILDWRTAHHLHRQFPQLRVFSPIQDGKNLPYLDETVDIVAISTAASPDEFAEARRVARLAVIAFPVPGDLGGLEVHHKVSLPTVAPGVSFIVPCQGALGALRPFLLSLRETLGGFDTEVLFVHDGASREPLVAVEAATAVDLRLRLMHALPGESFPAACNRVAANAAGDTLVFLLPDGCLLPDWLPPLLRTLREHDDAGAVGGRVITSNGELVGAGGELLGDDSLGDAGTDVRLDAPFYSIVRAVDYVSPAMLATPAERFRELGGFVIDSDGTSSLAYCQSLREHGYRAYVQPESVLVLLSHTETSRP